MATYQSYLNSLTDADLKKQIYCNRKQTALGVTINSDEKTKENWMAECGAILDNPTGNESNLMAELTRRGLQDDIPTEYDLPDVKTVDVNTNQTKTAGLASTNIAMIIIVGGFLYYAYTKGLLK